MQINLANGFYVSVDPLNYTLKKRYTVKDKKDGSQRENVKVYGYYKNIESAVKRFLDFNQVDSMEDVEINFMQYVEMVKQINEKAVRDIMQLCEENTGICVAGGEDDGE